MFVNTVVIMIIIIKFKSFVFVNTVVIMIIIIKFKSLVFVNTVVIMMIIIKFSFIGTKNIPRVTNAGEIYKSNLCSILRKLSNILEFAVQSKCRTIIAAQH